MTEKCTFHLSLRRRALQGICMGNDMDDECEVSGMLGEVLEVKVSEDLLVEIKGTHGMIRLLLPQKFLMFFIPFSKQNGPVKSEDFLKKAGGDDS